MIEVAIKCVCKKNDHWEASAMTHVGGGAVGYAQICTKKGSMSITGIPSIIDNYFMSSLRALHLFRKPIITDHKFSPDRGA